MLEDYIQSFMGKYSLTREGAIQLIEDCSKYITFDDAIKFVSEILMEEHGGDYV
jgi:hypothetical protein